VDDQNAAISGFCYDNDLRIPADPFAAERQFC
jgi:hypothetical protein